MSSHPNLDQEDIEGLSSAIANLEIPARSTEAVPEPASEPPIKIERLDPKGDLVLAMGDVRLLVSSRVLELSCTFFEKMLQPGRFAEGAEQPSSEHPPTKDLQEEHPHTLRLMCQMLHHIPVQPPKSMEDLIEFADTCAFYGCAPALSFHVQAWMESWSLSIASNRQLQGLLWVTFVFRLRKVFRRVSGRLVQSMAPGDWKAWEVHPMPGKLKEDIRKLCEDLKWNLLKQIETVFRELGVNDDTHAMIKEDKSGYSHTSSRCSSCGTYGPAAKKFCTKATRSLLFKEWLEDQGFWPFSRHRDASCRFLFEARATAFLRMETGSLCESDECPLTGSMTRLCTMWANAFSDSPGLSLESYDNKAREESHSEDAS